MYQTLLANIFDLAIYVNFFKNDPYSHPVLDGGKDNTGFQQAMYGGYKKDAPDAMRLGGIAKRLVAAEKNTINRALQPQALPVWRCLTKPNIREH